MATDRPTDLSRAIRSGRLSTLAAPAPSHRQEMGALNLNKGSAADGAAAVMEGALEDPLSMLDANDGGSFDSLQQIFGAEDSASTAAPAPAATRGSATAKAVAVNSSSAVASPGEGRAAQPAAEQPPLNVPRAPLASRLARFSDRAVQADPLAAPPQPAPAPAPARGSNGLSKFRDVDDRPEVVNTRRAMAAAKVVTPLVEAVSFHPGSLNTDTRARAKALSEMLVAVHSFAQATADAVGALAGKDVPQWQVTQYMEAAARTVSQRWMRQGPVDVKDMTAQMQGLFLGASSQPQIFQAIQAAGDAAYLEVDSADTARCRVATSSVAAAWQLYDWVTRDCLAIQHEGDQPSAYFTWGRDASEVVNFLLLRAITECQTLTLAVDSADLRTAHMQASIRRMADLIGAEYAAQTLLTMGWIQEQGPGEEARHREATAIAQFEAVMDHVFGWARQNFIRIENGAMRAVEQRFESNSNLPASGSRDGGLRPASD